MKTVRRQAEERRIRLEREAQQRHEAAKQEAARLEAVKLEAAKQEAAKLEEAAKLKAVKQLPKQELSNQDLSTDKPAPQVPSEDPQAPLKLEVNESIPNLTVAAAPVLIETIVEVVRKPVEVLVGEAIKAAADAKGAEMKAFALRSGSSMGEKIQARKLSKEKTDLANELIELKLKVKGENCNTSQLKDCSGSLKELLAECITQYDSDKCSEVAFDTAISDCVGKCISDPINIL